MAEEFNRESVRGIIKNQYNQDRSQSMAAVHRALHIRNRMDICSLRTVQNVINELKAGEATDLEVEPGAWIPWQDGEDTSEDVGLLLRLSTVSRIFFGRSITECEAKWAWRLRVSLDGLNPFLRLIFAREFARREGFRAGAYFGDLHSIIAFQPWLSDENAEALYSHSRRGESGLSMVASAVKGRSVMYEKDGETYLRRIEFTGRDRWNINLHTIFSDFFGDDSYGPPDQLDFWTWGEGESWAVPEAPPIPMP
ncbi:MAG: hypothetical protein O3A33_14275 [Chloroflexi bacterium]|nr:hypothetical protein [Chloroflexota bacterium]